MSDFKITRGDGVEEECTYVNQTTPLAESYPAPQPEGTPTMEQMKARLKQMVDEDAAVTPVQTEGMTFKIVEQPIPNTDTSAEPLIPPAGARETPEQFYEEWIKKPDASADNRRSFFRFAEAYAASERARESETRLFTHPEPRTHEEWFLHRASSLAYKPVGFDQITKEAWDAGAASERARADKAERRLATFEDEHKRFLIISQTAVDLNAECESLRSELREAQQEIKRLILQYTVAHCWWDDDTRRDSPDEYADEMGLKVGDEFELQASTYWDERFRVTKVPDDTSDDYECETISKPREEFETYQQMEGELRDMREALTAMVKRLKIVMEWPEPQFAKDLPIEIANEMQKAEALLSRKDGQA